MVVAPMFRLSARGRAKCHMLGSGDDLGGACDSILIIEVFGGIGGLLQACELLGVQPGATAVRLCSELRRHQKDYF